MASGTTPWLLAHKTTSLFRLESLGAGASRIRYFRFGPPLWTCYTVCVLSNSSQPPKSESRPGRYVGRCGPYDGGIDPVFAPELAGLDRERIRDWYNGYSWGGGERLYNPFDALLLFRTGQLQAWWFETGTPTFLVETLVERGVPSHKR